MKPPVRTHEYTPGLSDRADLHPQTLCGTCGLPRRNRVHAVAAVSEEQRQLEQRRIGDTNDRN